MNRVSVGLWLLIGLALLGLLGYRDLFDPDEGRYAEIAREMLVSGDWITPRLNGLKYFEKPPLQYWATAVMFKLFGIHAWTARAWPGLCALGTVALTCFGARRLSDARGGQVAALSLASCLLFLAFSQIVSLDAGVTCFLTLTLCGFLAAHDPRLTATARARWAMVMWVAMALAVLSKGLIGVVLPGLTWLAHALVERRRPSLAPLHWRRGLLLFGAVAAPWFVMVQLRNPGFLQFFVIHEHFARFAAEQHNRPGPWYFFAAMLFFGCLPWSLAFARACLDGWRQRPGPDAPAGAPCGPRLLVVWAMVITVFFSLSSSKLPAYVLPVLPALAMLLGWSASQVGMHRAAPPWRLMILAGAGLTLAMPFVQRQSGLAQTSGVTDTLAPWMTIAGVLLIVSALVARWLPLRPMLRVGCCAAGMMVAAQALQIGAATMTPRFNCSALLTRAQQPIGAFDRAATFYSVGMYDQTLPLALQRLVRLVAYSDEFAFGQQQEPQRWIPTLAQFRDEWQAADVAYAMLPADVLERQREQGMPYVLLAAHADVAVISRR